MGSAYSGAPFLKNTAFCEFCAYFFVKIVVDDDDEKGGQRIEIHPFRTTHIHIFLKSNTYTNKEGDHTHAT